jgi:teichuronic acid biosynthesis glycosyltransferase TuaC
MRVAVVAEYYPRRVDPTLGVWAHRQAVAARDAGADVEVFVLHRPIPPRAEPAAALRYVLQRPVATIDGIRVNYVPFLAPPRPRSYASWGAWAAPTLRLALNARGPFDVVHAHYAVPGGDAARRALPGIPLVISVHGGDVLAVATRFRGGEQAVRGAFAAARLVLANSAGIAQRSRELGALDVHVVHLGTDVPPPAPAGTALVTVGNLIARKRHIDVVHALRRLDAPPRYVIVGDGPERAALEAAASGLDVEFRGRLDPRAALAAARDAAAFVLPSVEEAFGVAYVEAMAAGVPAIGTRGEPGPEEIAACGGGMTLVPARDPDALAAAIEAVRDDPAQRAAARANVEASFTWEACGRATVAAYEEAQS